jgi:hypothetical protein
LPEILPYPYSPLEMLIICWIVSEFLWPELHTISSLIYRTYWATSPHKPWLQGLLELHLGQRRYLTCHFYQYQFRELRPSRAILCIWKTKCIPKIKFFAWLPSSMIG